MSDLLNIANNSKLLKRYTNETVAMLQRMDVRKHNNACMTLFHTAQFGECFSLNLFFNGLKVNDQTALKAWIVKHTQFTNEEGKQVNWLSFTNKKDDAGNVIGFRVVKGTEKHRKDVYVLDELLALEPFFETDVSKQKVWDLNALLETLIKAAETVEKKSEKESITLPLNIKAMVAELRVSAAQAIVPAANGNDEKSVSNVA